MTRHAVFAALVLLATAAPLVASDYDRSPVALALTKADRAVVRIIAIPDDKRTFANTVVAIDDLIVRLDSTPKSSSSWPTCRPTPRFATRDSRPSRTSRTG